MNFPPSLHLSKLLCEAVTDSLHQTEQTLSMQQLCAFLWGLTKVSHLQESAGSRGSGTRLSDVYGGSGRGWQKRKAAPSSTQIWQESIMPVVRAAQDPAARHIRTLHPEYARVRASCRQHCPYVQRLSPCLVMHVCTSIEPLKCWHSVAL